MTYQRKRRTHTKHIRQRARHHAKRILRQDFLKFEASRTDEARQASFERLYHMTVSGTVPFVSVHDYHIGISQKEVNEAALAWQKLGVFEVKRDHKNNVVYSSSGAIYTRPTLKYFTDPGTWFKE